MSDENTTHFQFTLGEVKIEINGERSFVERMYKILMTDIESARSLRNVPLPKEIEATVRAETEDEPATHRKVVWVHRCGEMMHKIYMSSSEDLGRNRFLRQFDMTNVDIVYAQDDAVDTVLPGVDRNRTLWAELTAKGRQKIADAQTEGTDGTF